MIFSSRRTDHVPEIYENEISINYVKNRIRWNKNEVNVYDVLLCNTALNVMSGDKYHESKSITKWKTSIKIIELTLQTIIFGHEVRNLKV